MLSVLGFRMSMSVGLHCSIYGPRPRKSSPFFSLCGATLCHMTQVLYFTVFLILFHVVHIALFIPLASRVFITMTPETCKQQKCDTAPEQRKTLGTHSSWT